MNRFPLQVFLFRGFLVWGGRGSGSVVMHGCMDKLHIGQELGCIDADRNDQLFSFQHLSRSGSSVLNLLFGAGADLLYGPMRLSHSVRFGG